MDIYEELQKVLDAHPTGAPESKYFDEILRMMFTPEEAAIAAKMCFSPRSPEQISASSGVAVDELRKKLEAMADKVSIFSADKDGKRIYGLIPTIPGLFEFPFMKGAGTPDLKKLGKLWEEYHRDGMGKVFASSKTPLMRVVAVRKSLNAQNKALPYEEVANLIKGADAIGLAQCACRESVGACDKPRDNCLIFNTPADFLISRGYARRISREEAMAVLDRAEGAGLVHTTNNSADRANMICNCCPCCCTVLRGRTQLELPNAFATSSFIATVNEKDCNSCGICIDERCPMKAIEMRGDTFVVIEERCIGCGLCVTGCPTSAIALKNREAPSHPVCATSKEMGMKVLSEKGRLEEFLKIMKR
jgi:Na+-translocating ferredoxin:NAD+ oxidoreductase subunit B